MTSLKMVILSGIEFGLGTGSSYVVVWLRNEMFELGIESSEKVVALASSGVGLGTGVIHLVEWVGDVVLFGLARGRFLKETS
jgi:hypothetical protein